MTIRYEDIPSLGEIVSKVQMIAEYFFGLLGAMIDSLLPIEDRDMLRIHEALASEDKRMIQALISEGCQEPNL